MSRTLFFIHYQILKNPVQCTRVYKSKSDSVVHFYFRCNPYPNRISAQRLHEAWWLDIVILQKRVRIYRTNKFPHCLYFKVLCLEPTQIAWNLAINRMEV
jgi:hypothetical protein